MAVPTTITDLNVSAASNSPAGSDTVATNTGPDEYIRALAAIIKREQSQFTATASATTVDLGAIATGSYGHITGTTTITGFGTVAEGIERTVVFDGALTLTHNATSLILPGGANITTAAGDIATFRSEGFGNWRCVAYVKASGAPVGSYQPLDALLTALAGQTTAANNVQAYSGADTPTLLSTGTASGNIPLVGTKSATETLAGLVELATQAEAEAGTDDTVVMTPLKTAQAIAANSITSDTLQATTSGTEVNFSGVPDGVKRITVSFQGVSLSGTGSLRVRIGDSGGIEATGYVSTTVRLAAGAAVAATSSTSEFIILSDNAAFVYSGHVVLTLADAATNLWIATHSGKLSTTQVNTGGGEKALSGTLTQLSILTNGADTFDGGSVNILYE